MGYNISILECMLIAHLCLHLDDWGLTMHCIVLSARYHLQFSIKHMQLNYAQTGKQLSPHNIIFLGKEMFIMFRLRLSEIWAGLGKSEV